MSPAKATEQHPVDRALDCLRDAVAEVLVNRREIHHLSPPECEWLAQEVVGELLRHQYRPALRTLGERR